MKRRKITAHSGVLFLGLSFLQIVMLLSLAVEVAEIERYCSYLILLLGMGLFAVSVFTERYVKPGEVLLFAMIALLLFVGVLKEWKYEEIVSVLVFSLMFTVWRSAGAVNLTPGIINAVRIAYILQGAMLIILSFTGYAYESYQEYVEVSRELTLGFDNPNQTGIVIFCVLAVLLVLWDQNRSFRELIRLEIVGLSILLLLTNARMSILAYIVFLFLYVRTKTKLPSRRHGVARVVLWFPLFFVVAYLWLSETRLNSVMIFGKKLYSGRQRVYSEALASWTDKVFGNLDFFGLANAHNSHLTILINFGIFGFLLYMLYTTYSFDAFYGKCKSRRQYLCVSVILCLFMIGCAESAVLTGGTIYYIFMLTYVVLGREYER